MSYTGRTRVVDYGSHFEVEVEVKGWFRRTWTSLGTRKGGHDLPVHIPYRYSDHLDAKRVAGRWSSSHA